jgi:glycosyltransferase involved in cell wall biosynthesis
MKILFVIPTYKPAFVYGGPVVVVSMLAEALVNMGHDVSVYTTTGNGKTELDVPINIPIMTDGVKVYYFKRYTKDHSHISPGFLKKILLNVNQYDVVHLHSWWNPLIILAAGICKLKGVRPVLSPHGMFCKYILVTRNKVKKQLTHLVTKSFLANCYLHVSTLMEWKESQLMVNNWGGIIIPNLVKLSYPVTEAIEKQPNSSFVIGFISRIDPKKGLEILIAALARVTFDYRLQIAGSGEDAYVNQLKQLAVECGNSEKIDWVGWKDNAQKFQFYSTIDLFALTSHNENFAVVVIESLSVGTPVFLSNNVGLSDYVQEKDLGWVTLIDNPEEIACNFEKVYKDHKKQAVIYKSAPHIIRDDYNVDMLTEKYTSFYTSIIKKSPL